MQLQNSGDCREKSFPQIEVGRGTVRGKLIYNIYRLIAKVLNDQNLFTESNLIDWFSSYVQFCSGGHFSKRAEAAL